MERLLNVILIVACLNVSFVRSAIKSCYKDKHTWISGSYCIEINEDTMDWDDARSYCRRRGGDLINIQNSGMQSMLESQLKLHTHLAAGYWIGATDRQHERHWTWVHGTSRMTYSNWESGQGPLQTGFFFSDGGLEDCAMIRPDAGYKWHDGPCAGGFAFHYALICQYDLIQSQTVSTKLFTTMKPTTVSTITTIPTTFKPTTSKPTTIIVTQSVFPTGDGDPLATMKPSTNKTTMPYKATTVNSTTAKSTSVKSTTLRQTTITQKPTTQKPTTTTGGTVILVQSALTSCHKDKDFWVFGYLCIDINDNTMDWDDARDYCYKRGGDLIAIRSAELQKSVETHLKLRHHNEDGYWIGATDRHHEDTWLWVHGIVYMNYSHWEHGQGPTQTGFFFADGSLEDCAMIRPDAGYKWHDGPCAGGPAFHYGVICQYDFIPNGATVSATTLNYTNVEMSTDGVLMTNTSKISTIPITQPAYPMPSSQTEPTVTSSSSPEANGVVIG